MANVQDEIHVWAYRVGKFRTKGGEWTHSIPFTTLPDLVAQLVKANIPKGKVRKLAIFAHGDRRGLVELHEGELTSSTAANYSKDLQAVRDYLCDDARLIFYSCVAAQGKPGLRY